MYYDHPDMDTDADRTISPAPEFELGDDEAVRAIIRGRISELQLEINSIDVELIGITSETIIGVRTAQKLEMQRKIGELYQKLSRLGGTQAEVRRRRTIHSS